MGATPKPKAAARRAEERRDGKAAPAPADPLGNPAAPCNDKGRRASNVLEVSTNMGLMRRRSRLLSITAAGGLALAGLAVAPLTHAFAATGCDDTAGNEYKEVSIAGGSNSAIPGMPFTLAAEIGDGGTVLDPHVGVCFGTNTEAQNAAGQPEVAGGAIFIDALNPASNDGFSTGANLLWDSGSNVKAPAEATTTPSYAIVPGPAGGTGDTIALSIPFTVCFGPCSGSAPGLNPTGLLVGQLAPAPEPGIGIGYSLQSLDVYVNGALVFHEQPTTVAGAYVDPFGAVEESLNFSQGGPCSSGVCVPQGYVGTTGSNLVGFTVMGFPVSVAPPKACPYYNPNTDYCP